MESPQPAVAARGAAARFDLTGRRAPAGPHPIELATLLSKEAQLRGCLRFRDEIDAALDLLARDPGIARVVTHEVPADDVHAAFATARNSESSGKVLVRLWGAES